MKCGKWLVVPLGEKNVGIRSTFVTEVLHPLLGSIVWPEGFPVWGSGFQLQAGEPVTVDGWARPFLEWARDHGGANILHWETNQTKQRLYDAAMVHGGKLDDWLISWAKATRALLDEGLIRQAIFHNASIVPFQPDGNNLIELAKCPVGAKEILDFYHRRAIVRARLTEICGERLLSEPLNIAQFYKRVGLPLWFEGQDLPGAMDWEVEEVERLTGIRPLGAASEGHWMMTFNFIHGYDDWAFLREYQRQPARPTRAEKQLADLTGVWFCENEIPVAVKQLSLDECEEARWQYVCDAYELLKPISAQVEASVSSTVRGGEGQTMIGSCMPFNPADSAGIAMLEFELRWALAHPEFEIIADAAVGAGLKYGAGFGPLERKYGEWGPESRPTADQVVKLYDPLVIAGELFSIATGLKPAA